MYTAIEKGHMNKVPLMIGICSEELIWWASGEYLKKLCPQNNIILLKYIDISLNIILIILKTFRERASR